MTTTSIADNPSPSNGRRLPLRALAAILFLAVSGLLLIAACGGDDEESTVTPGGTRPPAATQAPAGTQAPAATPAAGATQTATTTPQASSGEIDPCSLLTKAEVEAAIGASVTEPEPEAVANLVACSYNDPETPIFSLVSVTVFIGENADQASDVYELTKDNAADAQTVAGIGNDAFWDSILNGLEVLEGKYDIRIDVSPDGLDELAAAKDLATKVVDRLP
jgi:hypothetical protein